MSENSIADYITYGRTFKDYKWFKPLIVMILSVVFYVIFNVVLSIITGVIDPYSFATAQFTYESMNNPDLMTLMNYMSMAVYLPALYLAVRIVNDRPFSSYSSSLGGWRWKIYFMCMAIALAVYIIFTVLPFPTTGPGGELKSVPILTLIAFLIVIPLQCIAEEHMFRGMLLQTLGSWTKIPILAILIQSVIFAYFHPYNLEGVITIFSGGIIYGLIAWKTNGLEAGSAMHSINNLSSAFLAFFAIQATSSNVDIWGVIITIMVDVICFVLIYYIGNRYGWFEESA